MEVLLIRHGKAGERDPNTWPNDDLRPLTKEGMAEQRAAARVMKRLGLGFEFLVTSPLLRAAQTAALLADGYGWTEPAQEAEELGPGGTPAQVIRLLTKFPPGAAVALVGHEPALSRVAAALVGKSGDASIDLKKGGVLGLRFDGHPAPGAGTLTLLLKPGVLRRLK